MENEAIVVEVAGIDKPIRVTRSGHESFWGLLGGGVWEPENVSLLARWLGPGSTFVDVGAWIGPMTLIAARCGARVYAYEPDPEARRVLIANLDLNDDVAPRVTVFGVAIGTSDGSASLSSGALGDSMSSLQRHAEDSTSVETIDVRRWADGDEFRSADVVKVDIEGSEHGVVWRMRSAFLTNRPTMLLSVHGYHFRRRFRALPKTLRKVVIHLVNGRARIALLVATRRYPHRAVWNTGDRSWVPLTATGFPSFVWSTQDIEMVLSESADAAQ